MRRAVAWLLLAGIAVAAFGQQPQATIRVEGTVESVPIQGADVTVNGKSARTGQDGYATTMAPLGDVKVGVTKEGYFPANASLRADAAREWVVRAELEPQKTVEEQIKVYATRNDVRIQDSPLHIEVLQRDEVEEKMLMTPGDIVMMLNEMGGMRVQTTSPSLGAASARVFIGCRSGVMTVVNSVTGAIVDMQPIGRGVNAADFDPGKGLVYSSSGAGDGSMSVFHEETPDKYTLVETVKTQPGARTMALDRKTRRPYLSAAKMGPVPPPTKDVPRPRAPMIPGTFEVLVFGE